ncbi:YdcF family protein [Geobacter sp.]|uniref:YdcF family protein n=1 Tax=Geobacter sp. TaxID=46610 RepID=UPI0026164B66|nr:YdcF family protein [Geobacter sp.]
MAVFFRGLISLFLVFCVVMAVLFVDFVYKSFSLRPRDFRADAVVVLAGGRGRVEEGVRLFREKRGEYLFLVGVDPLVKKQDLFRDREGEHLSGRVYLEKASRNTLENAIYGRELIMQKNIRSIHLITSRYHMKRATLIFRHLLPKDIAIYPYPVDSKNLRVQWWSHGGSFRLLFGEFYKYCLFRFFFLFDSGEMRPGASPL